MVCILLAQSERYFLPRVFRRCTAISGFLLSVFLVCYWVLGRSCRSCRCGTVFPVCLTCVRQAALLCSFRQLRNVFGRSRHSRDIRLWLWLRFCDFAFCSVIYCNNKVGVISYVYCIYQSPVPARARLEPLHGSPWQEQQAESLAKHRIQEGIQELPPAQASMALDPLLS